MVWLLSSPNEALFAKKTSLTSSNETAYLLRSTENRLPWFVLSAVLMLVRVALITLEQVLVWHKLVTFGGCYGWFVGFIVFVDIYNRKLVAYNQSQIPDIFVECFTCSVILNLNFGWKRCGGGLIGKLCLSSQSRSFVYDQSQVRFFPSTNL